MDTNLVAAFVSAISSQRPVESQALLITTLITANVMTLAGMILAYFTNAHVKATTVEVKKIEHSVNSERTATLTKMEGLERTIRDLTNQLATGEERERGQALKDAATHAPPLPNPVLTEARLIEILNQRDLKK